MEGVTILQEIHETHPEFVLCIVAGAVAVILAIIGFVFRHNGFLEFVMPVIVVCLTISLVLLVCVIVNGVETISYLVIVDDSVSLNEFNEVYKIIGYKGKMLEVVLR